MRAIRSKDGYKMYRIDGHLEMWFGNTTDGVRVGYVSDADNFEYAVEVAKEEADCLMEEYLRFG